MDNQVPHDHSTSQEQNMTPSIEVAGKPVKNAFAKNVEQPSNVASKEVKNMSNEPTQEVVEKSNNPVSIADLYAEMESELTVKGTSVNTGVTARIRETVDGIFAATGKERLLLSAVVKIVEKQEGRKKMYNLVRSIGMSKSENATYKLVTEDGRTYIARK